MVDKLYKKEWGELKPKVTKASAKKPYRSPAIKKMGTTAQSDDNRAIKKALQKGGKNFIDPRGVGARR